MGRAAVRAAIAAYFAPANVAGLSTLYRARPKQIPETAFALSANGGSGAVVVVHLVDDEETRETFGGPNAGSKFNRHQVALEILFQSVKVDAEAAQDDHDALIDAILTRFRADFTLGSTNGVPIYEAGQDPAGIKLQMAEPVLSKQAVLINAVLRFEAWEYISGA